MRRIATLWFTLFVIAFPLAAQETALVRRLSGQVEVQRPGTEAYAPLEDSLRLPADARLRTGQDGIASILYDDGTEITVRPRTVVRVGGEAGGGASVFLGRIRVKAERLLQAQQGRSFRSPIAVAAIRGTEFGIAVDESTVTEVFVFEGTVEVANVQLPGQAVLVPAGSMTRVAPFVPPTAPRPFQQEEFDRLGRLDALERGEDPVLEASQEPAAESYLAYAVPTLDVVRNPAYAAGLAGVNSTTVLSASGFRGHNGETVAGATVSREDREGYDIFGRHVTLIPVAGMTAGLHAEAGASLDDRTTTVPGASSSTDGRLGLVRGLVAFRRGDWGLGVGASYRASSSRVDASAIGAGITDTDNAIAMVDLGLLRGVGRGRSLGMGFTHQALSSTVTSTGGAGSEVTGRDDAVRLLLRRQAGERRTAGLLELRQTSTAETFTSLGTELYEEDRDVWSVRAGPGVGLMPAPNLMVAGDLVGGFSYETASQVRPDGTTREDETDIRLSASLHAAAQLLLGNRWLVSLDVLDTVERTLKDFTVDPGTSLKTSSSQRIATHVARAVTGVGYLGRNLLAEYVLTAGGAGDRPFRHGIIVVWTP